MQILTQVHRQPKLSPAVSKSRNVKVQDGLDVLLIVLVAANRDTDK